MCGIAGFCDFNGRSTLAVLKRMTDALLHRGPDNSGYEYFALGETCIGIGHRRLSIIDLSEGARQPLIDESGNYILAFNGEIYNYQEIRLELEKDGYKFFTASDSEVLLKAYMRWGVESLRKLIGMFAFVIYDKKNNKLCFFRDRAGVKPLYYYFKDGLFLFASELKSFHQVPKFSKEISIDGLMLFFKFGYLPAPYTIFRNTYKLKPGHYIELDLTTRQTKKVKYWDVIDFYNMPIINIPEPDAIDELEKLLISAFNYRMVADVPVGVFLSGGYDSTAVTALLQTNMTDRLKTFTIGFFDERFNEAVEAKATAKYLGTDHTEYYCTEKDAKQIIATLPNYYDEPFIDTSAIPTILVSKIARKKVTVALSADGGDETFSGYDHLEKYAKEYKLMQLIPALAQRKIHALANIVSDFSRQYKGKNKKILMLINQIWKLRTRFSCNQTMDGLVHGRCTDYRIYRLTGTLPDISNTFYSNLKNLKADIVEMSKCMASDYQNYMVDDILTKVDRATMSVSLEGREPLLDHRIIEFVSRLPLSYKNDGLVRKKILKKIVHKHVPEYMINRPKRGFGIPIKSWLRKDMFKLLLYYLSEDRLDAHGLFDKGYVSYLKNRFLRDGSEYGMVWSILVFQMWYQRWMSGEEVVVDY